MREDAARAMVGGLTRERLTRALSEATALPWMGRGMHGRPEGTKCIQRISVDLEGDAVLLSTFPAELQDQAQAFYGDRRRVDRVLDLATLSTWTVRPNGHLSWWLAAPERRWYFTDGALDASQYMRQWQTDLGHVHSYQRDAIVTELWPWLLRRGYVGERDRVLMEEFVARLPRWPSWRWMTMSGTPSCAISTAWAWRSWCGAKRRRMPAVAAKRRSSARAAAGDHGRPRVGPLMTQNSGPTGSSRRTSIQRCRCSQAHASMPASRRRPPLPRRTSRAPRRWSRSDSLSASASWIRSPARHSTTIRPRSRHPWRPSPAARMTAAISSTVGGSAG